MSSDERETAPWITASDTGSSCVEVQTLGDGTRRVRDSKDRDGGVLEFNPLEWQAFVGGVRRGLFD